MEHALQFEVDSLYWVHFSHGWAEESCQNDFGAVLLETQRHCSPTRARLEGSFWREILKDMTQAEVWEKNSALSVTEWVNPGFPSNDWGSNPGRSEGKGRDLVHKWGQLSTSSAQRTDSWFYFPCETGFFFTLISLAFYNGLKVFFLSTVFIACTIT